MILNRKKLVCCLLLLGTVAVAGPYAPPAGDSNSTAIHMDDPNFTGWATDANIVRGYYDISNPSLGFVSHGSAYDAVGQASGTIFEVVSLGDGGVATLSFDMPIANGPGYDFAVFENSFDGSFLELAFVEVSSDGENFFRFNAVSLTDTDIQIGGFDTVDTTNLHNLAGKYLQGYGTPFDLEELKDINPLLDVSYITHVRIVDVVGSIQVGYCSYDSLGHIINDPWPTDFETGGFDLDGVGVIHEKTLSADLNGDGIVTFVDFAVLAAAYMSIPDDENWNRRCDVSDPADDMIDIFDLITVANQWLGTEQWY